jgi:gas vesicle protein
MARDDGNFLEVSFAFLLGGLVGATVALLYAPASGDQTRQRIREASTDVQGNVRDQYGRIRDKAEIEVSRLKSRANEGIQDARSYIDQKKSKVREAYQEGQRAFEEEKDKQEVATPTGDEA